MKAYLFDLDGTLADSRVGLYLSFRAALNGMGIPPPGDRQLARFLGTPLPEMFRALRPDIADSQIEVGINAFRAAYEREGIEQTQLYSGVNEMLEAIVRRDCSIWIVTSKPEPYAIRVVKLLALDRCVAGVTGAGLDEKDTKAGLIARAMAALNVPHDEAMMVGDRHYDIVGARANNVMPVGVLWGYGSREELLGAGCRFFARSVADFRAHFVEVEPEFRFATVG